MTAIATFILITLPWLNPFSPGPTSQVMPLLFALACTAGVLGALAFDPQKGETQRMVRAVVLAFATAAALSAVIGLMQYFGVTARFGVWLNHTEVGQAFGNLRQRNQFATLLNIGLAATLWLATGSGNARWQRLILALTVVLTALISVANSASASRTGLVQLALIVAIALWWQRSTTATLNPRRRIQAVVLTALISYAVATLTLPLIAGLDPMTTGAWARLRAGDAACSSRLTLWSNVLDLIGQKPWLGWGWGELDYAHFINLYPGTRFCDILDNAHNLPLHLAVELGVPVALLVCSIGLWLIWRGKPWREQHPTRQLAWTVLAIILLHSLLEYPLWYGPFQSATALSLWLLCWVPRPLGGATKLGPLMPAARFLYAPMALILGVYCSFAAWNYHLASQIYLDASERAPAFRDNTLEKIQGIWLYQDAVRFADLTTANLSVENAARINALAKDMLHFSPEVKVVELVLDSAKLLGRTDEVAFYAARYKVAFAQAYALWADQSPVLH